MKQKLFAFGDDFTIQDEEGSDRFFVDGRAFAIGDKLSFQDMEGHELASIEQKVLSVGKKYRILRGGRTAATIRKKIFTVFRDAFEIEDEAVGDLDARGDFIGYEYEFTHDGKVVATVSKRFFAWTDTYGVEIIEHEDHVLILAAAVVIDMCCHESD